MFNLRKFLENNVITDLISPNTRADQERRLREGKSVRYIKGEPARTPRPNVKQPARLPQAQNQSNPSPATTRRINQLQDEASRQTGFGSFLRDIVDANTSRDRLNRLQAGNQEMWQPQGGFAPGESRNVVEQTVFPAVGAVQNLVGDVSGGIINLAGLGVEALPGDKNSLLDRAGRGIQRFGNDYVRGTINEAVDNSRFSTRARQGEFSPLTTVSSGLGSLGSAIATTALTGGTGGAAVLFGTSAAGEQAAQARDSGLSPVQSIGTGATAGLVEGGLEKVGLDNFMRAGKGVTTNLVRRAGTEGLQEFSQSLGQSAVSDIYSDVDYGKATQQALAEGGYGALIGGLASMGIDTTNRQEVQDTVQTARKDPSVVNGQVLGFEEKLRELIQRKKDALDRGSSKRVLQLIDESIADTRGQLRIAKNAQRIQSPTGNTIGGINATAYKQAKQAGRVFEGVDGKERFEIDDSGAKAKIPQGDPQIAGGTSLDDMLDHPKLYEQYPFLKNASVEYVRTNRMDGLSASYDVRNNTIRLSPGAFKNVQTADIDTSKIKKSDIEKYFIEELNYPEDGVKAELAEETLDSILPKLGQDDINGILKLENPEYKPVLNEAGISKILHEIQHAIQDYEGFSGGGEPRGNSGKAYDEYRRLAGEAEARAVANRMNMSDGERQQTPFEDSLDVPKEDLIIRDGSGKAMSIDPELESLDRQGEEVRGQELSQPQSQSQPTSSQVGSAQSSEITPLGQTTEELQARTGLDSTQIDSLADIIPQTRTRIEVKQRGREKSVQVGRVEIPANIIGDARLWKDVGSTFKTIDRNLEASAPSETIYRRVRDYLIRPREKAATALFEELSEIKTELKDNIDKYGLKDKEIRAEVMTLGEFGQDAFLAELESRGITPDLGVNTFTNPDTIKRVQEIYKDVYNRVKAPYLAELQEQYGQDKVNDIVKADQWFTNQYNRLLNETNAELSKHGLDTIAYRTNYYTHFQNDNMWSKVGLKIRQTFSRGDVLQEANADQTRTQNIDPKLLGQTEFTKPKSKFNPFKQRRLGDATDYDALEAFERWLMPALHNKHLTESVVRTRLLTKQFQEATSDTKHLPLFIRQLQEYGNDLAGKTSRFDRPFLETKMGKKTLDLSKYLQRQMGRNTILGSVRSAVMQISALPQSVGQAGYANTAKGVLDELRATMSGESAEDTSPFLKRRYAEIGSALETKLDKAEDVAGWLFNAIEQTTTNSVWRAQLNLAKSQGYKGQEAIAEADRLTERVVGGRSIGEMPEAFRSVIGNNALQFQLEVNNFAQQMTQDFRGNPSKYAKTFIATMLLNELFEALFGDRPLPDPIDATGDVIDKVKEGDIPGAIGRLPGEILSNMPGGQLVAEAIPERGFRFPGTDFTVPGREDLIGDTEAGRYGGTPAFFGAIENPLYAIPNTFGLKQVDRTLEGIQANRSGVSQSPSGRVRFVQEDSPIRDAQRLLFGQYSTPNAREYFENERSPLGDNQSSEVRDLPRSAQEDRYNDIMTERELNSEARDSGKTPSQTRGELAERVGGEYDDYVSAFGLDETKRDPDTIAKMAIKGTGYDGLPDNILDQYLKENNLERSDIEYAVDAEKGTDDKLSIFSQQEFKDRKSMLNYLAEGRTKSIDGNYRANEKLLRTLYDNGVIDNNELYGLLNIVDGKYQRSSSGGSSSGGSSGGSRSSSGGSSRGRYSYNLFRDVFGSSPSTTSKSLRDLIEQIG